MHAEAQRAGVKLHLICLDAMPWGPDLERLAAEQGLTRIPTFNQGTYTATSMLARFTGQLPSDLVPRGVGYRTHQLDRFYRWPADPDLSVLTALPKQGWQVVIHNDLTGAFGTYLSPARPPRSVRNGSAELRLEWLQAQQPTVKLLSTSPNGPGNFREWRSTSARDRFFAAETESIRELQRASREPRLVMSNMEYFHDAHYYPGWGGDVESAWRWTMRWLRLWNWEEPNSVFVLFSDHGHRCRRMAPPPDHLTWSLVRDNRSQRSWPAVLSGADIFALAMDLALPGYEPKSSHARVPGSPVHPDRIFLLEDARGSISPYESTTAAATTVSRWSDTGEPLELTQVSWFAPWAQLVAFHAPVANAGGFTRIFASRKNVIVSKLMEALVQHFSWIDDLRTGPLRKVSAFRAFLERKRIDRMEAESSLMTERRS